MNNYFYLTIFYFISNFTFCQNSIDGFYIGLEKICWDNNKNGDCINTDKINPKFKWFHENIIKIKGDSIFMDQKPLKIYNNKKYYSASDGAFYYYKGLLSKTDNLLYFNFEEIFCDYCPEEVEITKDGSLKKVHRKKQLIGELIDGKLIIEGNTYIKNIQKK